MTELLQTTAEGPHVFLRRDALRSGYSEQAICRMTRTGVWVRIRHGAYVAASDWEPLDPLGRHALRTRAVMLQSRTSLVASHVSAVPSYGGPDFGLDLRTVHATRRDRRAGRVEAGVHQHQGVLLDGDVVTRGGVEVTSGTRTALDLTTVLSVEAALGQVNHLLHAGHTDPEALEKRYGLMEQNPHTLRTDLVLRLADPRIESLGESRTLFWLWKLHLPIPVPQYEVHDEAGVLVARLDFAWPDHGVWLEFDGAVKYERFLRPGQSASSVVLDEKRREDEVRGLTGWRCIRITWADLQDPRRLDAIIRRALGR